MSRGSPGGLALGRALGVFERRAMRAGSVMPYAIGIAACAAALAVSLVIVPSIEDDSIAAPLFLAAVGIAAWYGGFGPALVATALGVVAVDYFFETPADSFQVTSGRTMVDVLSFLLVATLIGAMNARLRRSNQRLRTERDHATAALAARDDLMAAVSHELRTPLTAIKTSVYSLRDPTAQLPAETRSNLLWNIESEVDRLAHFVSAALALRRLENGVSPRWELSSPGEIASAVLDRCLPVLGDRQVNFVVADGLPLVRVDGHLLDQALTALVENAAVHTPPGTTITIEAGVDGDDLRLSVSDDGCGVPEDARERVFEKYQRLNDTTPGVGLGLAIARAAVEAQGGRVWVQPSSQGGAEFVMLFPDSVRRDEAA